MEAKQYEVSPDKKAVELVFTENDLLALHFFDDGKEGEIIMAFEEDFEGASAPKAVKGERIFYLKWRNPRQCVVNSNPKISELTHKLKEQVINEYTKKANQKQEKWVDVPETIFTQKHEIEYLKSLNALLFKRIDALSSK